MKLHKFASLGLSVSLAGAGFAQQGPVPKGIPHLDHVFVIMMENHGYKQIVNNPNAPFINHLTDTANVATNYFAIAHPSLTNYLEVVGGSNFGVQSDNYPDWHSTTCTTNLSSGSVATDNPPTPRICPIDGHGTDAVTPAIDLTNETSGPPGTINIDGTQSIPADHNIVGKTIADQLVNQSLRWKSYQESLPLTGADNIDYSDGFFSNLTDFTKILPVQNPPLTQGDIVALYAAKHNPFAYFRDIQEGFDPRNSLKNAVDFEGSRGLFADLASGHVPSFSFIAPNQCNDQHGRGNAGPFCNFDPNDNGTQAGLNPALIQRGDLTVKRLVKSIKASPAWHDGKNAIVILWDENDYATVPETNQVLLIVDTNYGYRGVQSKASYNHFSLLKTIEAGFGLPCLNHACDADIHVMSDLFASNNRRTDDGDQDGDDQDGDYR
ncbi:MAG: Phosphoesterase family protein [Edaphobacter sp.]|nr:Phosphoesterase family protein [Edaphobacter sp.]